MRRAVLALVAAVALLPGCGFGAGDSSGEVRLTVTTDFGAEELGEGVREEANEGDTVMRVLQGSYEVGTRYGGGFVQDIDGVAGGREQGRAVDWFYYVNGVESSVGAAERDVEAGDRVWWDHHAWDAAQRVPAVVGSFPEPFVSGTEGKRLPVKLVCLGPERSCEEVETRLRDSGSGSVSRSVLEQSPGEGILRVVVGTWAQVRRDNVARRLEQGPQASGVFARPAADGRTIELLDDEGRGARTLEAGGGLVAATSVEAQPPTWIVTGTDEVGVAAAAAALTEQRLSERFAIAVDAGRDVPLPIGDYRTRP
jgi:hypothetical protein